MYGCTHTSIRTHVNTYNTATHMTKRGEGERKKKREGENPEGRRNEERKGEREERRKGER